MNIRYYTKQTNMSTYDRFPKTRINGELKHGWPEITGHIAGRMKDMPGSNLFIDCYTGVRADEVCGACAGISPSEIILTTDYFKSGPEIERMTQSYITEDVLFGYHSNLSIHDYFDEDKVAALRRELAGGGQKTVFGPGAALFAGGEDIIVYADMPRWEIQMRMRKNERTALGVDDTGLPVSKRYKRGFFNDWRLLDRYKCGIYDRVDYWLDTTVKDDPKLIDRKTFFDGLEKTVSGPFRVMPFFDPAPWGGHWMEEKFGLPKDKPNYGWCFDCVPEENSLLLEVNGVTFEMPSVNLVNNYTKELLGDEVEARFGKDFPIRFDFLDTMGGGNLSLQVHPHLNYSRDNFGLHYTQDESYYLIDAGEDATVYLGVKNNVNKEEMIADLKKAENGESVFDADKYSNRLPAKKHDHFLIPAGTVHCSGSNAVVLEISATPNLFTFKLWDWGRLGLDGKPRPINIDRGRDVIDFSRDTDFVKKELWNDVTVVAEGDGWVEERTGLHKREFIETRRHWFTKKTPHDTKNGVSVINLAEGEEIVVESPAGKFEPFVVHYGETFIIPACAGEYTIAPHGPATGKKCGTLKAYVRF